MKSDRYIQIYHSLPWQARTIAATLRGCYLRHWRYGPDTQKFVDAALEREQWSAKEWVSYVENRLSYVLQRAATQVPYYQKYWTDRRRRGDSASWEYIENWPLLEKEVVRQNVRAFVANDRNIRKMFHEHTSGTTGKPLHLWWSRETVQAWYALFEARCRRWYGVSRRDRWAILGGQLVAPSRQTSPPFWVWNAALNQLYMSSYHLKANLIPYYLDALKKYQIEYVLGYTSSLHALAEEILRQGRKDLQMTVAITNAEPVFEYQRKMISKAFRCPVRETYGMAEIVASASECHKNQLHLWPEVGWIEVFENGQAVKNGTSGDLVCTGLFNADMPLIRYRVGDRGSLRATIEGCGCGRGLPVLAGLEGRIDDLLYTVDGRRIGRLDPVFKAEICVREAQIIQEHLDKVRVRFVPAVDFTPDKGRLIVQRLRDRMGLVEVLLEEMDAIPRERNGKFRSVICQIPDEEKTLIGDPQ